MRYLPTGPRAGAVITFEEIGTLYLCQIPGNLGLFISYLSSIFLSIRLIFSLALVRKHERLEDVQSEESRFFCRSLCITIER